MAVPKRKQSRSNTRSRRSQWKAEDDKHRLCDDISEDLDAAARTIPLLPRDAARAVGLAHGLFARLNSRIRQTPAEKLKSSRIRVNDVEKLLIAARVIARGGK